MSTDHKVDHLFRHQYGKMVSSLTRVFGTQNLGMVEDVVQDTFQKALLNWRINGLPVVPEAWLMKVARNRAIDVLRHLKASQNREQTYFSGPTAIAIDEVFSDHEIKDNQLRLLFTICHPSLKTQDQIIFALKTFSGFSRKEIATALLKSEENIKKSLTRARKNIIDKAIKFEVPHRSEISERLELVHLVLYLLFNEGFHSSNKKKLIRKDLVAEALRLNGLLIERFNHPNTKALMALMCFHAARLDSKIDVHNSMVKLKDQDRSKWSLPLIRKGHEHMDEAIKTDEFSRYHWEAAIAGEYLRAESFEETNWENLEIYYKKLNSILPSEINLLNLCVVLKMQDKMNEALDLFHTLEPNLMKNRTYLYSSVASALYRKLGDNQKALQYLQDALTQVENESEKELILIKIKDVQLSD